MTNSNNKYPEILTLFPEFNGAKPFLKWAGGKSQLLPKLIKYIPQNYNQYIEPFIGGGALFFYLHPQNAIISDLNNELIITYQLVRDNIEQVITILETYKNDEKFYYKIRSLDPKTLTNVERAARLIYLNKTCFNGLYRVNKKGKFNVPYNKSNGNFLDKKALFDASYILKNSKIIHADYQEILNKYAKKGDFVFLDPPYFPVGKYSDFKRYTKEFFYTEDHKALKNEFDNLVKLGCFVILTNSSHPFILDLYKKYEIIIVDTKRLISSNPDTRKGEDIIVLGGF